MKKLVVIDNLTRRLMVCSAGFLADTFIARVSGLLLTSSLDEESGLLIRPTLGVHTFGMRFPIDIVSLDEADQVLRIYEDTGSRRFCGFDRRTRSILELPSGRARRCGLMIGDQLAISVASLSQSG